MEKEKFNVVEGGRISKESEFVMSEFKKFKALNKDYIKEKAGVDTTDFEQLKRLCDVFVDASVGEIDFEGDALKQELYEKLKDILPSPEIPPPANEAAMPKPEETKDAIKETFKKAA